MAKAKIVALLPVEGGVIRECEYEGQTYYVAGDVAECAGYARKGVATYINRMYRGKKVVSAQVEGMGKRPLYLLTKVGVKHMYELMKRPEANKAWKSFKLATATTKKEVAKAPTIKGATVTINFDALSLVLPKLSDETKNAVIMDLARRAK